MAESVAVPVAAAMCFVTSAAMHARRWAAALWVSAAGVAILSGALVSRGLRAGHWPLTGQYEFALAFSLGTALAAVTLGARARRQAAAVQAVALTLAAGLVAFACLALPPAKRNLQPLVPALNSVWLPLHVGAAALGYGGLAVAGAAGLAWLLRPAGQWTGAENGELKAEIEQFLDRAVAVGYPLLTLSILLGMVWAQQAWGRYWGWDVKEVWTLITWLVYTLYWHLSRRPTWRGRRLAWLAVAGLLAVLFTFLGVGWLARAVGLESLHQF